MRSIRSRVRSSLSTTAGKDGHCHMSIANLISQVLLPCVISIPRKVRIFIQAYCCRPIGPSGSSATSAQGLHRLSFENFSRYLDTHSTALHRSSIVHGTTSPAAHFTRGKLTTTSLLNSPFSPSPPPSTSDSHHNHPRVLNGSRECLRPAYSLLRV